MWMNFKFFLFLVSFIRDRVLLTANISRCLSIPFELHSQSVFFWFLLLLGMTFVFTALRGPKNNKTGIELKPIDSQGDRDCFAYTTWQY